MRVHPCFESVAFASWARTEGSRLCKRRAEHASASAIAPVWAEQARVGCMAKADAACASLRRKAAHKQAERGLVLTMVAAG